ncbi:MAG: hypothetical protein JWM99_4903 [Verrucomicrobiales bacterium]|nr:hypothetical protein [Verrucomicrobiales bacterium]
MVKNLQILIADDHPIFRRGLKDFIIDEFPNVAFTEVASAEQVLQVLQKKK